MKKLMAFLVTSVFAVALLVGCGTSASSGADSSKAESTEPKSSSSVAVESTSDVESEVDGDSTAQGSSNSDVESILTPPGAKDLVKVEGAITGTSSESFDGLISFYEDAVGEIGGNGDGTKVDIKGAESWAWVGTYGDDNTPLSITVTFNPLGDGFLVAVAY